MLNARPNAKLRLGLGAALVVAVLTIIALINLRGARKLDEQIDGLRRQLEE